MFEGRAGGRAHAPGDNKGGGCGGEMEDCGLEGEGESCIEGTVVEYSDNSCSATTPSPALLTAVRRDWRVA